MYIPSREQIEKNFRKDITLKSWRAKWHAGGTLKLQGEKLAILEHFKNLAKKCSQERSKNLKQLKSYKALKAYGNRVRKVILEIQGLSPLPKKTPLNPVITGIFYKGDAYKVEKLYFESRPGFYVTANFYIPLNVMPPYPTVLFCQGHSPQGKYSPTYQNYPAALAVNGMAVLNIDPAGQGERDEYADIKTGKRTVVRACRTHGVAGDPMYLTGGNFGGYRLWDAIRALDYLESREEVDTSRLGAMGMSGGGWESLWLAAIDKRIKAVNSAVYTTTIIRRIDNRGADPEPDPEQDPFSFISRGLDIADVIMASSCARAAVSLAMMDKDFFPLDGALKTFREAKNIYGKCGLAGKISAKVFHGCHGGGGDSKGRMAFCLSEMKKALCGTAELRELLDFAPEKEKALFATKSGVVLKSLGGKTSAELNAIYALNLAKKRKPLNNSALKRRLAELLGISKIGTKVKILNTRQKETVLITNIKIKTEGKLASGAVVYENAKRSNGKAVVFVGGRKEKVILRLAKKNSCVVCVTPVGMEPFKETYLDFVPLTEADLSYDAFLLGKTLSGMRVSNILSVVALLVTAGYKDITVQGEGYGALLSLFAAALDESITTLVERKGLFSLSSLCYNREYAWPVSVIVPNILKHMDLPEIRESILPREVVLDTPLNHLKKPMSYSSLKSMI